MNLYYFVFFAWNVFHKDFRKKQCNILQSKLSPVEFCFRRNSTLKKRKKVYMPSFSYKYSCCTLRLGIRRPFWKRGRPSRNRCGPYLNSPRISKEVRISGTTDRFEKLSGPYNFRETNLKDIKAASILRRLQFYWENVSTATPKERYKLNVWYELAPKTEYTNKCVQGRLNKLVNLKTWQYN